MGWNWAQEQYDKARGKKPSNNRAGQGAPSGQTSPSTSYTSENTINTSQPIPFSTNTQQQPGTEQKALDVMPPSAHMQGQPGYNNSEQRQELDTSGFGAGLPGYGMGSSRWNYQPSSSFADVLGFGEYDANIDPFWSGSSKNLAEGYQHQLNSGEGPAMLALKKGQQQNLANSLAAINNISGVNPAVKQRMVAQKMAEIGSQTAQEGAILKGQEDIQAKNALATLLLNQYKNEAYFQGIKSGAFSDSQDRRQDAWTGLGSALIGASGNS